jgi:serine/threonine protein phosphatase 1
MVLRSLFSRKTVAPQRSASIPAGQRLYAIGDIHGRRDCLNMLLAQIDADEALRGAADTTLIFLGDLVDRGTDSRGVIDRCMTVSQTRKTVFLMGNHEEIMIRAWEGDKRATALFHRVGGRETMISYGLSAHDYDAMDTGELTQSVGSRVPPEHIAFLRNFEDSFACGDYLFVHAGIRPGVPINAQDPADLRWIRREFLDDNRDHGAMIVHGHSITEDVDEKPNRIGIDTGAFASGKLTALGIEGAQRWVLSS